MPPNDSLNLSLWWLHFTRFTPSLCKHTNVNGRILRVCSEVGYWSSLWCECSLCHHNITITITRCKMVFVIIFLPRIWCCFSLVIIIWYHLFSLYVHMICRIIIVCYNICCVHMHVVFFIIIINYAYCSSSGLYTLYNLLLVRYIRYIVDDVTWHNDVDFVW